MNDELLDIAERLCSGYLSMPCGCEGCPIFDWASPNEPCELKKLKGEDCNE